MGKEHSSFSRYAEECRSGVIAEIGRMEAQGYNLRALKNHVVEVEKEISGQPVVDSNWDSESEPVEKKVLG